MWSSGSLASCDERQLNPTPQSWSSHGFKLSPYVQPAAAGTVYWLDIVMGFSTGFVVIYNLRRKVVTEPRLVAEYYMWHSTFFADLLAALPLIAEVGGQHRHLSHGWEHASAWSTGLMNHLDDSTATWQQREKLQPLTSYCHVMAQIICLPIPHQSGGLALHIILLLRLFRMWRVVKFAEVCDPHSLASTCQHCAASVATCHCFMLMFLGGPWNVGRWRSS